MKSQILIASFVAASTALTTNLNIRATRATGAVTDDEIIETLLRQDAFLLPKNSTCINMANYFQLLTVNSGHKMLVERTRTLSRRKADPQVLAAAVAGGLYISKTKLVAPEATVPEVQTTNGEIWKEAKRTKVRYGPYRLPATSEVNWESKLLGVRGMADTLNIRAKKPCTGECTILSLFADLEYADGSAANNSNGAWLHQ
jgi:hypothetical protein